MEERKNVIIGFGKAGKTLAGFLAGRGEDVVLVEKDRKMYGGTCINVGCIPSKFLSNKAQLRSLSAEDRNAYYKNSVQSKKALIAKLNEVNYHKIADLEKVEVVDGEASFLDSTTVEIKNGETVRKIKAERIFINTGMTPVLPRMEGLVLSDRVLTSETIMSLEELPESLIIIGAGYIGLEFATTYTLFGSKVSVIGDNKTLMPREDEDMETLVKEEMETQGVKFALSATLTEVREEEDGVKVSYKIGEETFEEKASHVLVATGRKPNIEGLNLEKAGVEVGDRGEIKVNERLETSRKNIYALGDVHGGLQFTYLSLDDFRIIKNVLFGDGSYDLTKRKAVPYNVFLHPSFARVGMNEKEAKEKGISYKLAKLPVMAIPKAKILGNQTGLFKVLIEEETGMILGANFYGLEAHELINIFTLAINEKIHYSSLRDQIYTHPTMGEAINDLLGF